MILLINNRWQVGLIILSFVFLLPIACSFSHQNDRSESIAQEMEKLRKELPGKAEKPEQKLQILESGSRNQNSTPDTSPKNTHNGDTRISSRNQ